MKFYKGNLLFIFFIFLFTCTKSVESPTTYPTIKTGTAYVSGKVIDYNKDDKNELNSVSLRHTNPVTAEMSIVETNIDDNGCFSFEISLECDNIFGIIRSNLFEENALLIDLAINKKSEIEIIFNENGNISVDTKGSQNISPYDILKSQDMSKQLHAPIEDSNEREGKPVYKYSPEEYSKFTIDILNKKIARAEKDSILSKEMKIFLINNYKLFVLNNNLLEYSETIDVMRSNYISTKSIEEPDDFIPQEPSLSYFSFLRDFNLNDPQRLREPEYFVTLEKILSNNIINIPRIEETSIDIWLKGAKRILSDITGFNSGQFYDLLAAHAYAKQLKDEMNPLSEKQINNITKYFKGKKREIAKILLRKNEEIIKLAAEKELLVVNKTPEVLKENLMAAIVSKYKGKVVVVDFWATWCGPCLAAMKEYRVIKGALKGKDIVFVYLTNRSSPYILWEEQIKGIGGEHYYLNDDEWEYIMSAFDFEYIPSYVVFDSNGEMRNKFTGYPGNAEMQKMIEELL